MKIANIHITDVESFTQCRRKWNWESPLRCGLQRAQLPPALFLGQGVHVGLDAYYKSGCDVNASRTAFDTWAESRIAALIKFSGPMYEQERDNITELRNLGLSMLFHYHLWSKRFRTDYEVVMTERKFKIYIPRPGMMKFPSNTVQLAGRLDGIARERATGRLFVLEFKTAKNVDDNWMFKGLQGTAYTWAAHKLFGGVSGILYHVLRKKAPARPKPLQRGGFSQAVSQDTSFEYFKHCLSRIAEMEYDTTNDVETHGGTLLGDGERELEIGRRRQRLYRESLKILSHLNSQENPFFRQVIIPVNVHKMRNAISAIYYTAMQMIDKKTPVFAIGSYWCNGCAFKDPCKLHDHGMDYNALIDAEYARRDYWEDAYGE